MRLVDLPNAGLRSFILLVGVGRSVKLGLLTIMKDACARRRVNSLLEVSLVFVLMHVTYRSLMYVTSIGALDRRAGTNLLPGVVMILYTVGILLSCRRDFSKYGISLVGVPARWFCALLIALGCVPLVVAWQYELSLLRAMVTTWSLVIGAGVGEEFLFRGYIQSRVNESFGRPFCFLGVRYGAGLVISSVLFGFLHTLNTVDYFHGGYTFAWGHGALTLVSGLLFASLREATGGVAAGIIAHSLIDIVASSMKVVS